MPYIDFHTHQPSRQGETVVQDGIDTWGAHPWKLILPSETLLPQALAIGECGLDRLCDMPYEVQTEVFRHQIRLSQQWGKPMIIHCVRAIDDVLRMRREEHADLPWVIHGFRGKPEQMHTLTAHGCYVSFGFRHNEESLRLCPPERLLLETDTDPRPVCLLYETAAQLRNTDTDALQRLMEQNYITLFGRKP